MRPVATRATVKEEYREKADEQRGRDGGKMLRISANQDAEPACLGRTDSPMCTGVAAKSSGRTQSWTEIKFHCFTAPGLWMLLVEFRQASTAWYRKCISLEERNEHIKGGKLWRHVRAAF